MQPTTITLSSAEAAIIYFHNIAKPNPPPPKNTIKISSKEQIKSKFDTALWQQHFGGQNGVPHEIGRRMAPYLEQGPRQYKRANLNHKRNPPRMVFQWQETQFFIRGPKG